MWEFVFILFRLGDVRGYQLDLTEVSEVDLGTYTCHAVNTKGQTNTHVLLTGTRVTLPSYDRLK